MLFQLSMKKVGVMKTSAVEEFTKSINGELHQKLNIYVNSVEEAVQKIRYRSGKHAHEMYIPPKSYFYIENLGYAGVCRGIPIFMFLLQNIYCGYTLEPPRRGEAVLTYTHSLCFEQK